MFLGNTAVSFVNLLHILAPIVGDSAQLSSAARSLKVDHIVGASRQTFARFRIALKKHNTRTTPHIFIHISEK